MVNLGGIDLSGVEMAIGLLNLLVVLFLVPLRSKLRDLETENRALQKTVSEIQVLVAGQYLRRDEFLAAMKAQTDTMTDSIKRLWERLDKALK